MVGRHEKKDPQTGEWPDRNQPEPKGSGRPGKHRKVVTDWTDDPDMDFHRPASNEPVHRFIPSVSVLRAKRAVIEAQDG